MCRSMAAGSRNGCICVGVPMKRMLIPRWEVTGGRLQDEYISILCYNSPLFTAIVMIRRAAFTSIFISYCRLIAAPANLPTCRSFAFLTLLVAIRKPKRFRLGPLIFQTGIGSGYHFTRPEIRMWSSGLVIPEKYVTMTDFWNQWENEEGRQSPKVYSYRNQIFKR